jgi:hypothetical protein
MSLDEATTPPVEHSSHGLPVQAIDPDDGRVQRVEAVCDGEPMTDAREMKSIRKRERSEEGAGAGVDIPMA